MAEDPSVSSSESERIICFSRAFFGLHGDCRSGINEGRTLNSSESWARSLPFWKLVADRDEFESIVVDLDELDFIFEVTGGTLHVEGRDDADVPRTELASEISLFCRVLSR